MSWWPESGLLRTVLEAKSSAYASIALACGAIIALAVRDVPYLRMLPGLVLAIVFSVGLLTFALFLGRMWDLGLARLTSWRQKRAVLAQLDQLSASEAAQLRHQVEKNEQTFSIAFYSPVAAGLRHKGLLELSSNLGNLQGGHLTPSQTSCGVS